MSETPSAAPRVVSAFDCAREAWRVASLAPGLYLLGGFLFILLGTLLPVAGDLVLPKGASHVWQFACTVLTGPMWVGLCLVSLAGLTGNGTSSADLFGGFHPGRLAAGLIYGALMAAVMSCASFITDLIAQRISDTVANSALTPELFPVIMFQLTMILLILLLPLVLFATYFFPAGFYLARGETNVFQALRRSGRAIAARKTFWTAFWLVMSLGHLAGLFACCVGIFFVIAWNCAAIGAGLLAQDPSLQARPVPPPLPPGA
jgi:hypothetical protein